MDLPLPVTFKKFVTDPVKGVLFLCLIAIGYLYIDNRKVYKEEIQRYETRTQKLEQRVEVLENKLLEVNHKL